MTTEITEWLEWLEGDLPEEEEPSVVEEARRDGVIR